MKTRKITRFLCVISLLFVSLGLVSCDIFWTAVRDTVNENDNGNNNNNNSNNNGQNNSGQNNINSNNNNSSDAAVVEGYCPNASHPHAIDLGNGVYWACCNIGANAPWEMGGLYAWGETNGKQKYDWSTYQLSTPGGYVDIGNDIAGSRYDAATANWGGRWKMPSSNQINALLNCTKMQAKLNGMKGVAFIGANGNKIFMPAAGYAQTSSVKSEGDKGHYWTSTLSPYGSASAFFLSFSGSSAKQEYYNRSDGRSVRAVYY